MTIDYSSMTTAQLEIMEKTLSLDILAFDQEQTRQQARLDSRIERQAVNGEALAALELKLSDAQDVLTGLENLSADAAVIAKQQAAVDGIQREYNLARNGAGVLSEEHAALEQLGINRQQGTRASRETELTAIRNEISSR